MYFVVAITITCAASLDNTSLPSDEAWSFPPLDPAAWKRVKHNKQVLMADEPWEGLSVNHPCACEPQILFVRELNEIRMYYRGGWYTGGIGVAFSHNGIAWKKYDKNPIFGGSFLDSSGYVGSTMQPWVVAPSRSDDKWRLFVSVNSTKMAIATSWNGLKWEAQEHTYVPLPVNKTIFGNRAAWQESNGHWYMFQESGMPDVWEIYLYSSNDGFHWVLENEGLPLRDLQVAPGGAYGGPSLATVDGILRPQDDNGDYHLFYHAVAEEGNLPTDIYHAHAPNLRGPWTVEPARRPLFEHLGKGWEYDQVADPSVSVVRSRAFMLYDGDNNVVGDAGIGLATAHMSWEMREWGPGNV